MAGRCKRKSSAFDPAPARSQARAVLGRLHPGEGTTATEAPDAPEAGQKPGGSAS